MSERAVIRTPDQRLRVFVSSTLGELASERAQVRRAIEALRLVPVLFELGARPHPPRELYRAYLDQSQVFLGIYWQRYGWVPPGEVVSGLEDEYQLAADRPRLIYIKEPAPDREPRLAGLLARIRDSGIDSYKRFTTTDELVDLVQQDLALLLTERFEASMAADPGAATPAAPPPPAPVPVAVPLGSLVGRDHDLGALLERLEAGTRLVTITGTGGIGKTRLALALAETLTDRYPDGVHVVPLASVEDPQLVLPTVASRLGVRLAGAMDVADALAAHLHGRRTLLVLDNLEQVAAAAGDLGALLTRLPHVQMLATSRGPLRIGGEQEWPLAPLGVPTGPQDGVADSPAVRLFVERARAADPTFTLETGNAGDVVALCRRLDGLPLAIELAAARVRLLPPAALLRRLGDRLDVLVGGGDRPERHRTLRATIDWSARLLTEREQEVFARLSVFVGGCTLTAAEAVCDPEGHGDVVDAVAGLLDHGLLVVADDRDDDEPRVRMLDTVRTEAAARLAERGETELLRGRHLAWFAQLADAAQPFLCGPDQLRWAARMDPERANLRTAATTALSTGETATLVEFAWDLYVYYYIRGAHQEPADWMAAAAQRRDQLDERLTAILDTALAISALWRGEHDGVRERLQPALASFVADDLDFDAAVTLMHLGLVELHDGRLDAAVAAERAASARFAAVGHDWGVASSENLLGVVVASAGDLAAASRHHTRALEHARRIGNETLAAQALVLLAAVALDEADYDITGARLGEAIDLLEHARDAIGAAGCLEVLGALALHRGTVDVATTALAVADATRQRLGTPLHATLRRRVEGLVAEVARQAGPRFGPLWDQARDDDPFASLRVGHAAVLTDAATASSGG